MEKKSNVEANALTPILQSDRKSWISIAFVQAGICVCVPAFLLGTLLAEAMPVGQAIITGSLGYLIAVVVTSIIGMIGCDLGMASCTICESTLGKKGARYIASFLFGINLIGWFGIQNALCGEAFSSFMLENFNIYIPVVISIFVWGFVMLTTAIFGMSAFEKLDYISVPFLLIVMTLGVYLAIGKYSMDALDKEVEQTMSFIAGVGLSFNFYAVGSVTASDITRFQRSRKDTVNSTFWGVFPMGVFTLVLGIIMTKIAGIYDISMVLIAVGIPIVGILSLIISTWTTNSSNAYCAGLNLVMAFNASDNRRREVTMVAGIAGTILAAMGILNHVEGILSLLSFFVCPIGGIMIADYWIIGKGKPKNWHSVKGINKIGVISFFISSLLAFILRIEYSGIIFGIIVYIILEHFVPSQSRNNKEKIECEN